VTEESQTEELPVVNMKELRENITRDILKGIKEMQTPAQKPEALTENVAITEEDSFKEYKEKLCEMLKDRGKSGNVVWMGDNPERERSFYEAIGATSAGSAVPEIWAKDVFRCCPYPASAFWDAPFIKWHEEIHGKPGDTIHVITVGTAVCGTAGCAEPVSEAPSIGAAAITMEEYQCSLYICRNDLEDIVPDTITEINNSLASCLDTCIDNAFIANLKTKGAGTLGATLEATMSATYIAEAIGSMRNGTCEPVALIIHPVVEANLLQDSQFVNAATFGDRSVITSGHIIKYLGLDIIVIPKGSLVFTGTYDSILLSRYAVHAAKKRDPVVETQYLVKEQKKYIYASVRFGKTVICTNGLWHIYTTT